MTGELIINGKDAYTEWGLSMGDNFLDALGEKAGKKDYLPQRFIFSNVNTT